MTTTMTTTTSILNLPEDPSSITSGFLPGVPVSAFDSSFMGAHELDAFDAYVDLDSPPMSRPGSPPSDSSSFGASFMPADLFRELMDSECLPENNQIKPVDSSFIPLDAMKGTLYTPPQSPNRSPNVTRPAQKDAAAAAAAAAASQQPATGFGSFSFEDMDLLMLDDTEISDALLLEGFGATPATPALLPQQQGVPTSSGGGEFAPTKPKASKGGAKRPSAKAANPLVKKSHKKKPSPLVKVNSTTLLSTPLVDAPKQHHKVEKKSIAALKRAQATEAATEAVREAQALSSEDPSARRLTHNVLERKRRNDLKNSYQELRECIPDVENNERTPTGQILIKAMQHVTLLKKQDVEVIARIAKARQENDRLRKIIAEHGAEAVVPALPVSLSA